MIEHYKLQGQVNLLGYQKNPYIWISRADAFVLSSYYEGFPNVVLEALSCSTPVISTPAPGGTKEILESIDGCYLSNEISATSIMKAISDLAISNNLWTMIDNTFASPINQNPITFGIDIVIQK